MEKKEVMEKKGFFKPQKRPFVFSVICLVLSVFMFIPPIYTGSTEATGTSYMYIMAEMMVVFPAVLTMLEGILTKHGDEERR